jgi:hypothetical protein
MKIAPRLAFASCARGQLQQILGVQSVTTQRRNATMFTRSTNRRTVSLSLGEMVIVVALIMLLTTVISAQELQKTDYRWLNGKWSGQPPLGGTLEMTLRIEGNQISGNGLIRAPKRGQAHPDITGRVEGETITISTHFPKGQATTTYRCTAVEGDLHCKTTSGYETVFKKFRD